MHNLAQKQTVYQGFQYKQIIGRNKEHGLQKKWNRKNKIANERRSIKPGTTVGD